MTFINDIILSNSICSLINNNGRFCSVKYGSFKCLFTFDKSSKFSNQTSIDQVWGGSIFMI